MPTSGKPVAAAPLWICAKPSMNDESFWADMRELFHFSLGPPSQVRGQHACFCLKLLGHHVEVGDSVLVKAEIDDAAQLSWANSGPPSLRPMGDQVSGGKVILRASIQDFEVLLRHTTTVRVLQAFVHHQDNITIIDATAGPCFYAGAIPTQCHETLQVAEVFAGGFAGWSRAIATLRDGGLPVHVSWMLEKDLACRSPLAAMDFDLITATDQSMIPPAHQPSDTVLLAADFCDSWWRCVNHLRPVDIAVISPPCQPWSQAGKTQGFNSADGMLLLEVVEFLRVTGIAAAVVEEVDGFSRHRHFQVFMAAMKSAGFICQWRGSLQLSEIAPASRRRYFLIFVHKDHQCDVQFQPRAWRALGFPTLEQARAYFPCLPNELLAPCVLNPEVLSLYMSPKYLPKGPTGKTPKSVQACRIRTPHEQANCFMAQYHGQHLLPREHLEARGLLGNLLQSAQGLRFYASPEIACSHGVNKWMLLPRCDKTCMRILGNSLSPLQAAFVIGLALQFFPDHVTQVDAAKCVDQCQAATIRFGNALLLQVQEGWLLCDTRRVGELLASQAIQTQVKALLLPAEHCFRCVHVAAGDGTQATNFRLQVSQHIKDHDVAQFLDVMPDLIVPATANLPARMGCPRSVSWFGTKLGSCKASAGPLALIWADGEGHLIHKRFPDALQQVRQVCNKLMPSHGTEAICMTLSGARICAIDMLPAMAFAVPDDECLLQDRPSMSLSCMATAVMAPLPEGLEILVPYAASVEWYLAIPTHLLKAIGWSTHFSTFPKDDTQRLRIELQPEGTSAFCSLSVQVWLRNLSFLAPLCFADEACRSPLTSSAPVRVEIQVVGSMLWTGYLPSTFQFADLENTWCQACGVVGLPAKARIYSGPFPVSDALTLADTTVDHPPKLFRRKSTGALVMTVMPELRGVEPKTTACRPCAPGLRTSAWSKVTLCQSSPCWLTSSRNSCLIKGCRRLWMPSPRLNNGNSFARLCRHIPLLSQAVARSQLDRRIALPLKRSDDSCFKSPFVLTPSISLGVSSSMQMALQQPF